MDLAKIEGSVVSTMKVERLHGHTMLVVDLLKADMTPSGTQLVAIDTVGAGAGEVVLVVRGGSARQTDKTSKVPTDATIVAIIDAIVYRGKTVYEKAAGVHSRVSGAN